jgi:hypothetical protein
MSEPRPIKEIRFEAALKCRELEIELFWRRGLFFWGFVAATFVGYIAAKEKAPSFTIPMASFGVVCALAWCLANRASKFWYESWESKVLKAYPEVAQPLFGELEERKDSGWWLSARHFSASKLAIGLSDYVFLLFMSILVADVAKLFWPAWISARRSVLLAIFASASIAFVVCLFWKARFKQRRKGR